MDTLTKYHQLWSTRLLWKIKWNACICNKSNQKKKKTLSIDIKTAGRTTKWYYKRKAEETIEHVLEIIAPGQGVELLKMTKFCSKADNHESQKDLVLIYENAETWQTKR